MRDDIAAMRPKSSQIQIRVTPEQKAALKRLARSAGQDVSAYVLGRALAEPRASFEHIVRALATDAEPRFALAELDDLLTGLTSAALADAVGGEPPSFGDLSPLLQNYVAAMVEQALARRNLAMPRWCRLVEPLAEPHFAASLRSLRLYLLQASPVAFKRRNIFVDAGVGGRV